MLKSCQNCRIPSPHSSVSQSSVVTNLRTSGYSHNVCLTIDLYPSPDNVYLSDIGPRSLSFEWNPVITISCQAISYSIVASNCGVCPHNTTGTSVTCIGVSTDGSLCIFRVQTIVCTRMPGQMSDVVTVTLKGELLFLMYIARIIYMYWIS